MPRPPKQSSVVCYHCGSVETSKAGFNGGKQRYYCRTCTKQLEDLGKSLGRKPPARDLNRASKKGLCASATTFAQMFGDLMTAYKKAGFK